MFNLIVFASECKYIVMAKETVHHVCLKHFLTKR
jgi:hypothetical protein